MLPEFLGNVALYATWAVLGALGVIIRHRHRVAMSRVRAYDAARTRTTAGRSSMERPPIYARRTAA